MTITGVNAREAKNAWALAAVYAAFTLALIAQFFVLGAREQIFGDFHAFYCGGAAMLHGRNPYHAHAIAACESQPHGLGLLHTKAGVTAPVPFPGYVFVLFAPFALLPYVPAALLWLLLTLACTLLAIRALAQLTGIPAWVSAATVTVAYTIAVLGLGEVAPIALAALCVCALALRARRPWAAAAALCVAAILPHVALGAFVAVLLFERSMRIPVFACGAMLVVLDAMAGGPAMAVEYFARVLPAHAYSEIGYIAQYGLTWALHALRTPDRAAVELGNISYALACIAGITVAAKLRAHWNDAAWLVLLPPAFAVTGGPFMHYSEITLALPALFLLWKSSRGGVRAAAGAGIVLLCVPWQWVVGEPQLAIPAGILAATAVATYLFGTDGALRVAFGTVVFYGLIFAVALFFGPQVEHGGAYAGSATLAQSSWTAFIRGQGASGGAIWWLVKAPTWIGLLLLAAGSAYAAAVEERKTMRVVDGVPLRP